MGRKAARGEAEFGNVRAATTVGLVAIEVSVSSRSLSLRSRPFSPLLVSVIRDDVGWL
jgi:hypothetical protein